MSVYGVIMPDHLWRVARSTGVRAWKEWPWGEATLRCEVCGVQVAGRVSLTSASNEIQVPLLVGGCDGPS